MESEIILSLFYILILALAGGVVAKAFRLPTLIGYILAGVVANFVFPFDLTGALSLAEVGLILLLFSVGLELSFSSLIESGLVAVVGAILQITTLSLIVTFIFTSFGVGLPEAIVLGAGFSLSSTALVVKILEDKAETNAIHGRLMISWLLTQDLAVIAIFTLLPVLAASSTDILFLATKSITTTTIVLTSALLLGRMLVPYIIHRIAATNSRELLILSSVSLALGTALLVATFGISGALGAFIAGVVISESQENHAIFAETRPLRNLFVIIFFATLGLFIDPQVFLANLPLIFLIAASVLALKVTVVFVISYLLGYRGKTAIALGLGLSQIGEFSFVIFLAARELDILTPEMASIGISAALLTLITTPFMFQMINPIWKVFGRTRAPEKKKYSSKSPYKNHVIVCGHGRVGGWVTKALAHLNIPFVIVDYDQSVITNAKQKNIPHVYGDPAEPDILLSAGLKRAKAVVVTVPDLVTQDEVINLCQVYSPKTPIITRAHLDKDVVTLSHRRVLKVVQPEFEGALSIAKEIMRLQNKSPKQIRKELSKLRRAHTIVQKQ